ncbi:hypothetical protein AURDEDRAFT_111903 [Auricularia subglabra TFB-10046 SS5]|nr:hypothetical protein AURDEDRAFT_111903 [Auricularia subglabra TFB-10046 SS5]
MPEENTHLKTVLDISGAMAFIVKRGAREATRWSRSVRSDEQVVAGRRPSTKPARG